MSEENKNTNQEENQKVQFTPEQQAKINELIADAQGRAAKDIKAENEQLKAKVSEFATIETSLKTKVEELNKKFGKNTNVQDGDEDLTVLKQTIAEQKRVLEEEQRKFESFRSGPFSEKEGRIKQLQQELLDTKRDTVLSQAANQIGFVDVKDVISLTRHMIEWDETRSSFIIKNSDGSPRMNSAMDPMTPQEFYQEYATQKPHLVRADARAGTGGSETKVGLGNTTLKIEDVFGAKSSMTAANKLMTENPELYRSMRVKARSLGLI